MRLSTVILAFTSVGCLTPPNGSGRASDGGVPDAIAHDGAPDCTDPDGDGYLAAGCESNFPSDCAEGNTAIHPGAYDDPNNSEDEDCFGGALTPAEAITPNLAMEPSATQLTVDNDEVSLEFDKTEGASIVRLEAPGSSAGNMIYRGSHIERLVGVRLWDQYFSWDTTLQPAIEIKADNRAAWRGRVAWSAANGSLLTGVTHYTVFPDGRVHMDHEVVLHAVPETDIMSTFFTVVPDLFTHVDSTIDNGGPYDRSTFTGDIRNWFDGTNSQRTGHSCAYNTTDKLLVGMAWRVMSADDGPRLVETQFGGADTHILSMQYDWHFGTAPIVGYYRAQTMVLARHGMNPAGCSPLPLYAQPFTRPADLVFTAGELETGTDGDWDADGYNEGGGYHQLEADMNGMVDITIDTAGGTLFAPSRSSAFTIDGIPTGRDPVIYLDGTQLEHGRDYLLGTEEPLRWLYLARPLAQGSRLEVRTPPAQ